MSSRFSTRDLLHLWLLAFLFHWQTLAHEAYQQHPIASPETAPISVFILMGKTGSGKSTFIKLLGGKDLSGREPVVAGGIYSVTQTPTVYMTMIGERKVLLLDTPGFDDSVRENLDVLNDILSQLYTFALRQAEIETRGVIFLHDISETRFGGSQKKTLGILKALVGDEHLGNVVVGTTMWSRADSDKFRNEEERERNLLKDQWGGMYKTVRVPKDDKGTAIRIIEDLFDRPPALLLAQEEMLLPPHTTENTTVGKLAMPEGRLELEQLQKEHREQQEKFEKEAKRREEQFRKQSEDIKKKFDEEAKKQQEEANRRSQEQERAWKAKQEEEMKRLEEELQMKFEKESRAREEQARRENERLQEELARLQEAVSRFADSPRLDRWDSLFDMALLMFGEAFTT